MRMKEMWVTMKMRMEMEVTSQGGEADALSVEARDSETRTSAGKT